MTGNVEHVEYEDHRPADTLHLESESEGQPKTMGFVPESAPKTGRRQKVANYLGVTVERKEGLAVTPAGLTVQLIDLPGTYSLRARSLDEARTTLRLQEPPHVLRVAWPMISAGNRCPA